MESIWSIGTEYEKGDMLKNDVSADAVVIGAGMAGVLTAYFLSERGLNTVVLEASRVGSGQTKHTTAKITSQHKLIYSKLIRESGLYSAYRYASINQRAIDEYERIIRENDIDCEFKRTSAFLYSETDTQQLEDEARCALRAGIDAKITKDTELPFSIAAALEFKNQAQFHPLKFLYSLADRVRIYENTRVQRVEKNTVITNGAKVSAKYIVFATHYPFVNFPGLYFVRMHQERSYVIAIDADKAVENMYLGIDKGGLSFRGYRGKILLGGGSHRTGENSGGKYDMLRSKAAQYYPGYSEVCRFSAQDCITLDGIPYIGRFSGGDKDKYIATGFGKWGMTSSMVSAMLISDMITGRKNLCSGVFSPQRHNISIPLAPFFSEVGHSVKGLSKQIFSIPLKTTDSIKPGQAAVVMYNGKKAGVYKNESGKCFAVDARCPHLGCRLEWNPDEKSWDCPCHGSRFDYLGRLIDNPAQKTDNSL